MIFCERCTIYIKYALIVIFYSNIIFLDYIHINISKKEYIEIDNELKLNLYENDISFINKKTKIKTIAVYYPEYNNISYMKYFNISKRFNKPDENNLETLINNQIRLAKNHKIHGFAINLDLINPGYLSKITMNIFSNKSRFPFFIIWNNDNYNIIDNNIIYNFLNNIKLFFLSNNYIKIYNKPVLSINNPYIINNRRYIIKLLRKQAKSTIGELFLIYPFKGNFNSLNFFEGFDAIYDYSNLDIYKEIENRPNILYYSGYIYKNLILNELNINFTLFRTSYVNYKQFNDYKPEKFYMLNKIIFNFKYNNKKLFLFINSWNDYKNGNYLEYDETYGYASINALSKSILNISFENKYYLNDNMHLTSIAVQIHVFYLDILPSLIERLNSIPLKYDLYISTNSKEKKEYIIKCLENSNANKYEIKIFENKGRDVYPFITQMRTKYKRYKYICHLHTKKSKHKKLLGANWSEYLYNNLIGDKYIINDILYEFQRYNKLGFIIPEAYYQIIKGIKDFENSNFALNAINMKNMNFLLKRIFHKNNVVGDKLVFPLGNMFWAKTKSIYQIFNIRLQFPEELGQTNDTIMHSIERIWLYLVKLNGFFYKSIFKYF